MKSCNAKDSAQPQITAPSFGHVHSLTHSTAVCTACGALP